MKPRIGLLMTIGLLAALRPAAAQTWTQTSAPTNYWNSIAASADGTKLVAAVYGGGIYTSTNSGATWTLTGAPSDGGLDSAWESVASSADGTKLVAVRFYDNPIYLSTNSGINWSTNGPSENWQSVACSSDGKKLVAVVYIGGPIYTSTNSGTTWTQATNAPDNWWQSVASSADGNKLVVAVSDDGIYISQTMPSPQVNIMPINGNFKLSWLVPSTNFVMQQSSDLTLWADMTNAPTLNLTNLQNQVTLCPFNSSGFYRLKTP